MLPEGSVGRGEEGEGKSERFQIPGIRAGSCGGREPELTEDSLMAMGVVPSQSLQGKPRLHTWLPALSRSS